MMHLKRLLTTSLQAVPNKLVIAVLVVALLGFADAAYLTVEHFSGVIPPCTVGGCEQVLTSTYSTVAGIPVALGGSIYYLFLLICLFAYVEGKNEKLLRLALVTTVIGFVTSLYFFVIQAFVLHAFCVYCLGSATTSTLLFGLAIYVFSKYSGAREASVKI